MTKRRKYEAPDERFPEGKGIGKAWAAPVGTMFNTQGAEIRSIIGVDQQKGEAFPLVVLDMGGKWNRGANDTLVVSMKPDTAREIAEALLEAAPAAENDAKRWKP